MSRETCDETTGLSRGMLRRDGDVPDLTADPKLAQKELGWKAEKDLQTMCKDLWNWQSQNPKGQSRHHSGHRDFLGFELTFGVMSSFLGY